MPKTNAGSQNSAENHQASASLVTRLSDWLRRLKDGGFTGQSNGNAKGNGRAGDKRVGTIVFKDDNSFPELMDAASSSDNALRRWGRR